MNTRSRLRLAVSSCLLGNAVRYDGGHKKHQWVLKLCEDYQCVAICPEYAIGLGAPRPTINLYRIQDHIHACLSDPPHNDVTQAIQEYATWLLANEPLICGYVFKARSPSCGVASTPWYESDQLKNPMPSASGVTDGVFSRKILQLRPGLPVIEETHLNTLADVQSFGQRIQQYATRTSLE